MTQDLKNPNALNLPTPSPKRLRVQVFFLNLSILSPKPFNLYRRNVEFDESSVPAPEEDFHVATRT